MLESACWLRTGGGSCRGSTALSLGPYSGPAGMRRTHACQRAARALPPTGSNSGNTMCAGPGHIAEAHQTWSSAQARTRTVACSPPALAAAGAAHKGGALRCTAKEARRINCMCRAMQRTCINAQNDMEASAAAYLLVLRMHMRMPHARLCTGRNSPYGMHALEPSTWWTTHVFILVAPHEEITPCTKGTASPLVLGVRAGGPPCCTFVRVERLLAQEPARQHS